MTKCRFHFRSSSVWVGWPDPSDASILWYGPMRRWYDGPGQVGRPADMACEWHRHGRGCIGAPVVAVASAGVRTWEGKPSDNCRAAL